MTHQVITTLDEWDARFMRLAQEASEWSKDPDAKVGALVVSPDRRAVSFGYNGLPWGYPDDPDILCNKARKNSLTVHAEQNALANASFDCSGFTMYVTKAPCLTCALMLRQHRISRVVAPPIDPVSRWAQDQQQAVSVLGQLKIDVSWLRLKQS